MVSMTTIVDITWPATRLQISVLLLVGKGFSTKMTLDSRVAYPKTAWNVSHQIRPWWGSFRYCRVELKWRKSNIWALNNSPTNVMNRPIRPRPENPHFSLHISLNPHVLFVRMLSRASTLFVHSSRVECGCGGWWGGDEIEKYIWKKREKCRSNYPCFFGFFCSQL